MCGNRGSLNCWGVPAADSQYPIGHVFFNIASGVLRAGDRSVGISGRISPAPTTRAGRLASHADHTGHLLITPHDKPPDAVRA